MDSKNGFARFSLLLAVLLALTSLSPVSTIAKTVTQDATPTLHSRMNNPVDLFWLTSKNQPCTLSLVAGSGIFLGTATLSATLHDGAAPLPDRNLFFLLDGRWVATSATDANGTATCTIALRDLHAGTYPDRLAVYFAGDPDYSKCSATGPLSVARLPVTVTASDKSSVVGAEIPKLTYRATADSWIGELKGITISTIATAESPVGTYPISVTGPASTADLDFTYVPGVITIMAEPLVSTGIRILGPDSLTIPLGSWNHDDYRDCIDDEDEKTPSLAASFRAQVLDQNGNPLKEEHVSWSLLEPVAGVSVSSDHGVVRIAEDAQPGVFTLVATSLSDGTVTARMDVQLVAASPFAVQSVSLDRPALTLLVGEKRTLHTFVRPWNAADRSVTWTSGDETIATVDALGKITALKSGNAWITATTTDGGFKAVCLLTVKDPVPVTGVALDPTELIVAVRTWTHLSVILAPVDATNRRVLWFSSDETVVLVDHEGHLVGVHPGQATITVTTVDGSFTATCFVTVVPPPTRAPDARPYPDPHHD